MRLKQYIANVFDVFGHAVDHRAGAVPEIVAIKVFDVPDISLDHLVHMALADLGGLHVHHRILIPHGEASRSRQDASPRMRKYPQWVQEEIRL